jgi:2-oxoglutarate dehydrogenase E1 component
LQLAAEYNMFVCNITEPANFFHMLRRQMALPFRKPSIVMSPKSLLRHPMCISPVEAFTKGGFQEVIGDSTIDAKKVKRVLLCSGKIYYELQDARQKAKREDIAIVRIEQLAPFPTKQLDVALAKFKKAEIIWVQEEPENMGYYTYMLRMLRGTPFEVIARKASASPATGYAKVHTAEQAELLEKAIG